MATIPADTKTRIIQRLADDNDRNDIILELCEAQGLDWREAASIVDTILAEHAVDITLTKSPLIILLALVIFLGGIGLIAYVTYDVVLVYSVLEEASQTPHTGPFGALLIYLMAAGQRYFGLLLLSIAMIVGSLTGLQEVWAAIFARLGLFQDRG